jgi:hypothetical protein
MDKSSSLLGVFEREKEKSFITLTTCVNFDQIFSLSLTQMLKKFEGLSLASLCILV